MNTETACQGLTEGHVPIKTQLLLCVGHHVVAHVKHEHDIGPVKKPPSTI